MWLQFDGKNNDPKACKIAIGKVNAITGKPWNQKIVKGEQQDYVVIPDQPWLDGINAGDGIIKQFVAMPLGGGYTVEAQVTGKEDTGGMQIIVYNSKTQPQPQPQQIPKPQPQPIPVQPQPYPYPHHPTIPPHQPYNHPPPPPAMSPFVMQPMQQMHQQQQLQPMPSMAPSVAPTMLNSAPIFGNAAPAPSAASFDYFAAPMKESEPAPASNFSFAKQSAIMPRSSSSSMKQAQQQPQQQQAPIAAYPKPQVMPPSKPVRQEIEAKEMGLSAGGTMQQSIYADKYGADKWDENSYARIFVHIVNSKMYEQITGKAPPATPIDASAYTNFGYPWYTVYDEGVPSVQASGILSQVKTVSEIDKQKFGYDKNNNQTVNIPANQVHTVMNKEAVRDGDW